MNYQIILFNTNRMRRIHEMPQVEVHMLAENGPTIQGVSGHLSPHPDQHRFRRYW